MNEAATEKKPVYKKWWFWVIALIVIGAASNNKHSSGGNADASAGAGASTETASAAPTEPAITISAFELATAYDSNDAAADAKYKGKKLTVSGVVDSITKDVTDDTVIGLQGTNQFLSVHAEIDPSQEQKAIALTKGNSVTLTCTGAGEIISAPRLEDCIIN